MIALAYCSVLRGFIGTYPIAKAAATSNTDAATSMANILVFWV